jgi:predicted dienelactone hydrolase
MRKPLSVCGLWFLLLLSLALFAGCGSQSASSNAGSAPAAGDDDAAAADDDQATGDDDDDDDSSPFWPPDQPGPYGAGVITIQTRDDSRWELWGLQYRGLPLEIWYPTTGDDGTPNNVKAMVGDLPAWIMDIVGLVYGDDLNTLLTTPTKAKRDATPAAGGPFPVLLFSHGISAIRFQNYTLCEHLASHGFVVVAPDHYDGAIFANLGNDDVVIFNVLTWVTGLVDRPLDVSFVYHYLEGAAGSGPLSRIPMDLDQFGVIGHSYGGLTAMQAGPQYPQFVKAIAALNPVYTDSYPQDYAGPFFMLQSAEDEIVGAFNGGTREAFEKAASPRKSYVLLKEGSHYSVTDACALLPPLLIVPARGCGVADRINSTLANEISAAYVTAFFKTGVVGDERYREYLMSNHYPKDIKYAVEWPK